ncbi:pyridoxal phosphate-dependent aminotransferase [Candidatus Woesearchaeota archaeon]|nr:pyridoxal phosphate-dependent aminotransferase [Candidatus Woesearchaeota archaeon]
MKLAPRARALAPSETLAINARAAALRKQGKDVISFAVGEPDFPTPEHVCAAAKAAIDQGFTRYTPAAGIPELRSAIATRMGRSLEEIIVTCGGKHALYEVMQAILSRGDEILIPAPYWVSFPEMARLAGAKVNAVRTDGSFQLTADAVERALTRKSRALIVNSPGNPTGAVYRPEELGAIAELAVQRDLWIISDEVYSAFVYAGKHASISSFPGMQDRTVVIDAVSKRYAMTGWRIGWCAAPRVVADAVAGLQSHMTSNATSIAQRAALAALTGPQECVEEMVRAFDQRRQVMSGLLDRIPGVRCPTPEGAFYCFPDVSGLLKGKVRTSAELCAHLLEEANIACVPGSAFGAEGHIRLSYACSEDDIRKGMERFAEAAAKLGKLAAK